MLNYITKGDTIIFAPSFNDELNHTLLVLLADYKKIIFSDNNLDSDFNLFDVYDNRTSNNISKFNQPVNTLPPSITHLTFGKSFNRTVSNLSTFITHLTFGSFFNQSVDNLPSRSSITHLTFGFYFNHTVSKLPPKLTHLTFGVSFNHPVSHLPLTLTQDRKSVV